MFSHSYYMLTIAGLFSDGRNQARSNYAPRTLGSSASRILKCWTAPIMAPRPPPAQKQTAPAVDRDRAPPTPALMRRWAPA